MIYADGMLYLYTEKGELALVSPDKEKFDIVSQTSVTIGTEGNFTHPVINNGKFYVRRGNAMIVYHLKSR